MRKYVLLWILEHLLKIALVLIALLIAIVSWAYFKDMSWAKTSVDFLVENLQFSTIFSVLASFLVALLSRYLYESVSTWKRELDDTPYVTFFCDNTQIFRISKEVESLEYSLGGRSWKKLTTRQIVFGNRKGELCLRGKSEVGTNGATISFVANYSVTGSGDIRTLIDYKDYKNVDTSTAKFDSLFKNCSSLNTVPELPATELANECYSQMFYGCTSLKYPPKLPATKLAVNCYHYMFGNCTSLIEAPELPATVLAEECYRGMFDGCTSLVYAPELPALELVLHCYSNMFSSCTSLKEVTMLAIDFSKEHTWVRWVKDISPEGVAFKNSDKDYIFKKKYCANWLEGVSSTGTFWKNINAKWEEKYIIPSNWTVRDIDPDGEIVDENAF